MNQLVRLLEKRWASAANVREALVADGWRVSERNFAMGSTLRAVLTPLASGNFAVAVNANYQPSPQLIDWLLCHEVGHAMLRSGRPARWQVADAGSRLREERFCNRLADRLVGRTQLSATYKKAS